MESDYNYIIRQTNPAACMYDLTCKKDVNALAKLSKQSVVDVRKLKEAIRKAEDSLNKYMEWLDKNAVKVESDPEQLKLPFEK